MKVLTGKWVFNKKPNNNDETIRFKAHWVVRGFLQQKGVDYHLTYATIVNGVTSRVLLATVARYEWKIYQFDIVTVFLNGELPESETVYVQ